MATGLEAPRGSRRPRVDTCRQDFRLRPTNSWRGVHDVRSAGLARELTRGMMPRLAALDALRGLAALMVFAVHAELPGVHEALPGLDAGVLVFFALSGYLLYAPFSAALRNGRPVELRMYAVRRLLRIAPAYLVASFLISGAWFPELLADPIGITTTWQSPILVVWTLQLEIAFYVLLPLIAYGLRRLDTATRVRLLLIGGAGSIGITAIVMAVLHGTLGYVPGLSVSTIASYIWA